MTGHRAFDHIRSHSIESLRVELQEFRHRNTGARHFHLAAEDTNNVFLVAFMTVPQDSTGVAHILEHTALCGSKRYPVRDPFFMMSRRSLNTFMNAFTSSDWTAYPFASQNKKDFNNLLDVYLDAAFFPLLRELDFAQEGHRVEFEEPNNPASDLVYKGVVLNEMKGTMGAPIRRLAQDLQTALFPTVTYHHNSGGEPSDIPTLSHADLKAFHERHYHPSNAVFMTYGNIPASEHQERFESGALAHFDQSDIDCSVPDEQSFDKPRTATTYYATDESDTSDKAHVSVGWMLGTIADPRAVLEAHILSDVLLDNSSSPLRQALETSPLGSAPSPLCGVDDDNRQMVFAAGMEGTNPDSAEEIESLILDVVNQVARDGVGHNVLESVLHQLELSQREITGGGYPYGLSLILAALAPALHGGDAASALDQDALLSELREDIKNPDFIKGLAQRLLIDNPHRVRLVMEPDPALNERAEDAERAQLAKLKAGLDNAGRDAIVAQAAALEEHQNQDEDAEILPRVSLSDVPKDLPIAAGQSQTIAGLQSTFYTAGTNGIISQHLIVDLPALSEELLDTLPLFVLCLTEVGVNGYDYRETQAHQAAVTGGISAGYMARGGISGDSPIRGVFTIAGKCLNRNQKHLAELIRQTYCEPRFDELARLRELVAQYRAGREQQITGSGHALAMTAAGRSLSPNLALSHRWDGLAGLIYLRELDQRLDDDGELEQFATRLQQVAEQLQAAPRQLLVVSEADQHESVAATLATTWSKLAAPTNTALFTYTATDAAISDGYSTSTRVSFCAKAYPAVAVDHPDAPALQVLGGFLRNGYLHRALREKGGAYGGGAGYHSDSATFRFFSYRDPRFEETFDDFDASLDWLQTSNHESRTLEEAILGVIAAIDRPSSPAGEAVSAFYAEMYERTADFRRRFRARVLDVSIDDLKRVAEIYLRADDGRLAAIASNDVLQEQKGWQVTHV